MPKRPLPEIILALTTGCGRGTAIYGDLTELAATRGRAWFWLAYARTVISFTWRTAAGLLAGFLSYDLLLACFRLWDRLAHDTTRAATGFDIIFIVMPLAYTALVIAGLLLAVYAGVRYGLRDRMALLACMIFLSHVIGFALDSILVASLAPAAVLTCALCVSAWRRPTVIYATTVLITAATFACLPFPLALATTYVEEHLPHAHLTYKTPMPWSAIMVVTILIAMLVCSAMRRRLLESEHNRSAWI